MDKDRNQITEPMSKLFRGKNFGYLSTLMKDGSPQVSQIWVNIEDGNIIVNTAEGRLKHKNISRDPRIAICVVDQNNPYHKNDKQNLKKWLSLHSKIPSKTSG